MGPRRCLPLLLCNELKTGPGVRSSSGGPRSWSRFTEGISSPGGRPRQGCGQSLRAAECSALTCLLTHAESPVTRDWEKTPGPGKLCRYAGKLRLSRCAATLQEARPPCLVAHSLIRRALCSSSLSSCCYRAYLGYLKDSYQTLTARGRGCWRRRAHLRGARGRGRP